MVKSMTWYFLYSRGLERRSVYKLFQEMIQLLLYIKRWDFKRRVKETNQI